MHKVKLSAAGRIVIPKKVRDGLKMREGDEISLEVRGREIVIRSAIEENPVGKLYGSVPVAPEENPKGVARKWITGKIEESL